MFQRMNRLVIQLPEVEYGDTNDVVAVQELLGGKFGVMTLFNNYMYQSFNFRGKVKLKPFYDLVASLTAEKIGHVELVATAINLLKKEGIPQGATIQNTKNLSDIKSFITTAQTASPRDAMGLPWTSENINTSGNLVLDLQNNFFLECGSTYSIHESLRNDKSPCCERANCIFISARNCSYCGICKSN
ncbi:Mn-containing catalase OS=Ureibacillus acetophenoni OX=614649 GN=SAMN05877842_102316 PE=3 SV=1 [Ureibacillus acetophenoni]